MQERHSPVYYNATVLINIHLGPLLLGKKMAKFSGLILMA